MSKINLMIADSNTEFSKMFADYLMGYYSNRFRLYLCGDRESLETLIEKHPKGFDMVLISPDLYFDQLKNSHIKALILLTNGSEGKNYENLHKVHRFQSGADIVHQLFNVLSEEVPEAAEPFCGNKKTKVIGVCSPAGGTGTTCITVAGAITTSRLGKNTFYLSLEWIPSTTEHFDLHSEYNLSHVFYYLKRKSPKLSLKIEGMKNTDTVEQVQYFSPPENLSDHLEVGAEEWEFLLESIVKSGIYDVLFLDMSQSLDQRNVKVLELCDEILLVVTPEIRSFVKGRAWIKELQLVEERIGKDLRSKMTLLLNRVKEGQTLCEAFGSLENKPISISIPECSGLFYESYGRNRMNLDNGFGQSIRKVVQQILEN